MENTHFPPSPSWSLQLPARSFPPSPNSSHLLPKTNLFSLFGPPSQRIDSSSRASRDSKLASASKSSLALLTISMDSSWNASFLSQRLCSGLTSLITEVSITSYVGATTSSPMTLPDCFWDAAPRLTSVTISAPLIISGRAGLASGDPMLSFSSGLTYLGLWYVTLANPSNGNGNGDSAFTPNWTAFYAAYPSLTRIVLRWTNAGGSLPSSWPATKSEVYIVNNRFSGSIPGALFSNFQLKTIIFMAYGNQFSGSIPSTLLSAISFAKTENVQIDFSDNDISGSIPSALFGNSTITPGLIMMMANFASNQLSGAVPSDLLAANWQNMTSWVVRFDDNLLESVPSDLFAPLEAPTFFILKFNLASNRIQGSLPLFFDHMPHLTLLFETTLNLSNNQLSGAIPQSLMPNETFSGVRHISWFLESNSLTGTISPSLLYKPSVTTMMDIRLSKNDISGTVPPTLLDNVFPSFGAVDVTLHLAHNRISGPLSSSKPNATAHINNLDVDLSSNPIQGSIPEDYLLAFKPMRSLTLNLSGCGFTGALPKSSLGAQSNLRTMSLNFDSNQLSGSYPWEQLISNLTSLYPTSITLKASNNQFTGPITIPSATWIPATWLALSVANNQFSSMTLYFPSIYRSLDVSGNSQMTGTIPPQLFELSSSHITSLIANGTSLNGTFPNVAVAQNTELTVLDLSDTRINFCAANRQAWSAPNLSSCRLSRTNATECQASYPSSCRFSAPVPSAPTAPTSQTPTLAAEPTATEPSSGSVQSLSLIMALSIAMVISFIA